MASAESSLFAFIRVHRLHDPVRVEYRFDRGGPYVHGFDGQEIPPRSDTPEQRGALAPRARPANCPGEEPSGAVPPAPVLSRSESLSSVRRLAVLARTVHRLETKLVPWSEFENADEVFRGFFAAEEGLAWIAVLAGEFEPGYPTAPKPNWQVFALDPAGALRFRMSGGEREWPYVHDRAAETWPAWFDRLRDRS